MCTARREQTVYLPPLSFVCSSLLSSHALEVDPSSIVTSEAPLPNTPFEKKGNTSQKERPRKGDRKGPLVPFKILMARLRTDIPPASGFRSLARLESGESQFCVRSQLGGLARQSWTATSTTCYPPNALEGFPLANTHTDKAENRHTSRLSLICLFSPFSSYFYY